MIKRLNNQSGASIVIALLFFMICLAVGGVVITAASVGASTVPREKQSQQVEYDVGCAAQALGDQMASSSIVVVETAADNVKTFTITEVSGTQLARAFWNKQGATILSNYGQGKTSVFDDVSIVGGAQGAKGTLTFDTNLNMTAKISLDGSASYAMVVSMQAVPTYDFSGHLKRVEYEAPVIQKITDAAGGAA